MTYAGVLPEERVGDPKVIPAARPPTTCGEVRHFTLKRSASSLVDSTGVAIPNTGTLIEYDAVALKLVR
jgi:hypothetical protein